jgi:fibronectin type 3 domain-containing protein
VMLSGTATTTVQYEVDLSWNAPSSSADPVAGYNVYRSADGGSFTRMNSSPDDQVSYSDTAVQSGATYIYQVTSVDANGVESSPSNQFTLSLP